MKARVIKKLKYEHLIGKIPLYTKLKVSNEMYFIELLSKLGYREDKAWTDDEDEKLNDLMNLAKELTDHQIDIISKFFNKQFEKR